jgi:serine/threonine protein kinase
MDIKLANFLVDDHGNTILIDWEQSGAPLYTLAPEADGEWDVDEVDGLNAPPRLVYTQYQGPVRVNLPRGRPAWNVFPEWSRRWPRACEAAEVFSLGRTMWMLLQEVPQEDVEDLDPKEIVVHWDEGADDIPDHWKAVVMRCLERDPNKRIRLTELIRFWERQQQISLA